ncbi:MAG: hypothetical protein ACI9YL_000796 [Luteibaculaceae bacterium]|jgi:hypothetical protein
MKAIGKVSFGLVLAFGMAFSVFTSSCKKEKPTIVVITVIDTAGKVVPDALVHLVGNGTDTNVVVPQEELRFNDTKTTNGLGKVSFDYSDLTMPGQAGFAVLDVDASKQDHFGKTVVEVKEHQVNEATVRIRPE